MLSVSSSSMAYHVNFSECLGCHVWRLKWLSHCIPRTYPNSGIRAERAAHKMLKRYSRSDDASTFFTKTCGKPGWKMKNSGYVLSLVYAINFRIIRQEPWTSCGFKFWSMFPLFPYPAESLGGILNSDYVPGWPFVSNLYSNNFIIIQ